MNLLIKAMRYFLILIVAFTGTAFAADDAKDIRALINHKFDRPDATVVSEPIVIVQNFAVADWIQGEKGGRALLHKKNAQWEIMLCTGDSIRKANKMVDAGVPRQIASALAGKLSQVENNLPPENLRKFGLFGSKQLTHKEHSEHH